MSSRPPLRGDLAAWLSYLERVHPRTIDLASNENAVRPSEAVLAAGRARLGEANRYPEASAASLREALGRTFRLAPERIVCANGSSELISLLAHAYTSPGDEVLMGPYAYLYFETAARVAGAAPVRARGGGWTLDIEALLAAAKRTGARAIRFLGNLGMGRDPLPAGEDDVAQLESQVTGLISRYPCVIVCMYDVRTLSGRIVLKGGLEKHRLVVCADGVRENPYCRPEEHTAHTRQVQ